jgi:hypothetical protein
VTHHFAIQLSAPFMEPFSALFRPLSALFASILYSLVSSYYGNFISQPTTATTPPKQSSSRLQHLPVDSYASMFKPTEDIIDLTWEWNSLKEKKNRKGVACDFWGKTATRILNRC